MKEYLLDTHILIWLLKYDRRLNENIREDIDYYQHTYYASVESLREIVILQSLKKITLTLKVEQIISFLEKIQIHIISVEINHIKKLEKLPVFTIGGKTHDDPFDRLLIAQAIANKYILISSDRKFPFYTESCGLKLLINER
ncbi:PIN domain protein [Bacteroidales bacterium Barb6XT]|nr:PIN domain protein [Bacteroidales bacterium Barb6XT]